MVDDLGRIRKRLLEYYAPDEIEVWLRSSHVLFNGKCAHNLIMSGQAQQVDRLLDMLDSGAFT